jgi:hypothetical protein
MTEEIPHEEWTHFCDRFSDRHHGCAADVELERETPGCGPSSDTSSTVARDAVFDRVAADIAQERRVTVSLESKHHPVTRVVHRVRRIRLERDQHGEEAALRIDSPEGELVLTLQRETGLRREPE